VRRQMKLDLPGICSEFFPHILFLIFLFYIITVKAASLLQTNFLNESGNRVDQSSQAHIITAYWQSQWLFLELEFYKITGNDSHFLSSGHTCSTYVAQSYICQSQPILPCWKSQELVTGYKFYFCSCCSLLWMAPSI
jgi:hypothetical protein